MKGSVALSAEASEHLQWLRASSADEISARYREHAQLARLSDERPSALSDAAAEYLSSLRERS